MFATETDQGHGSFLLQVFSFGLQRKSLYFSETSGTKKKALYPLQLSHGGGISSDVPHVLISRRLDELEGLMSPGKHKPH